MNLSIRQTAITEALRYCAKSRADIYAATPGYARVHVESALAALREAGLVVYRFKRFELTNTGRNTLPVITHRIAEAGVYVPPVAVRRAGSCTNHLPSRVGDTLYYRDAR